MTTTAQKKLFVCVNFRANPSQPSCAARGSKQLLADLQQKIQQTNCNVNVEESPCMGYCNVGPNARLVPNGDYFHEVTNKKIAAIVKAAKQFGED